MDDLVRVLSAALLERLPLHGLGKVYSAEEMIRLCGRVGICEADVATAVASGNVQLRYRGGWSGVPVSLDRPNRLSVIHPIAPMMYALDTEAGIQAGALLWFQARGWIAREELPDAENIWLQLARTLDLSDLHWDPRSAGTACRDIVAQPRAGEPWIEIWEAKGRTAVEGDFYETFGQIFPIADQAVTRGWTNNRVPKHGRALLWANILAERWAAGRVPRIAVAVLVPDFPPPGWDLSIFHDGPSRYYPDQADQYARFVATGHAEGDRAFSRLLRHLADRYDLLDRIGGRAAIGFRFLGFQSTRFIRDFATGAPLSLDTPS